MDETPSYPGIGRAVVDLLFAPSRLFRALAGSPRVLAPMLALALGTGALSVSVVGGPMLSDVRAEIENRPMPLEQRAIIIEKLGGGWGYVTAAIPTLIVPAAAVGTAASLAALLAIANSIAPRPPVPFRSLLSLSAHVGLLDVLEFLLKLPLMFAKGTLHVYSSPALLLSEEASGGRLFAFLDSFDAFTIWKFALLTLGLSIIAGRRRGECALLVWSPWLLWVLAKTALHGLVSARAGLG